MRCGAWSSLLVLAALACGSNAEPEPGGASTADSTPATAPRPFTTDSAAYTARAVDEPWPGVRIYGFTMITRYTNPTSEPIYLGTCQPDGKPPMYNVVTAERPIGRGIAYNAAWACVGHDRPITVAPGATRVDTIAVRGPNGFDGAAHVPIDTILEGRFRMRFHAQRCRGEGECPIGADSLTSSNDFSVRVVR